MNKRLIWVCHLNFAIKTYFALMRHPPGEFLWLNVWASGWLHSKQFATKLTRLRYGTRWWWMLLANSYHNLSQCICRRKQNINIIFGIWEIDVDLLLLSYVRQTSIQRHPIASEQIITIYWKLLLHYENLSWWNDHWFSIFTFTFNRWKPICIQRV